MEEMLQIVYHFDFVQLRKEQSLVDGNPLWRHFSGRLWVGNRQYAILQVSCDVRFL